MFCRTLDVRLVVSDILTDKVVDSFDDSVDEKNEDSGVESGSNTENISMNKVTWKCINATDIM